MKKRKNLLIWAGVVNFIIAGLLGLTVAALLSNMNGIADEVKKTLLDSFLAEQMTQAEAEKEAVSYLNYMVNYSIVSAVINVLFGAIYLFFAHMRSLTYLKNKVWLVVVGMLNMFLGMNLISAVLVIIVEFSREEIPVIQISAPIENNMNMQNVDEVNANLREQVKMHNITDRIAVVKKMKEDGTISEEEYNKMLNDIVGESVDKN